MRTVSGGGWGGGPGVSFIIQLQYLDYFRNILTNYFIQLLPNLLIVVFVIYTR